MDSVNQLHKNYKYKTKPLRTFKICVHFTMFNKSIVEKINISFLTLYFPSN